MLDCLILNVKFLWIFVIFEVLNSRNVIFTESKIVEL